jgi:L-fucose mutarotase
MLKNIDPLLTGELLDVMQTMGHGDDLVICDRNHPAATIAAHTTHGRLILIAGATLPQLSSAILKHFPLDTFVEAPIARMQVVGAPQDELVQAHRDMQVIADHYEGRPVGIQALERFAFYEAAKRSFAIVQTSDPGPYGCFILKKGVL